LLKVLIGSLINKKDLMIGNKIMNRRIDYGSTVVSSYLQI
jgi:hypothetical protein